MKRYLTHKALVLAAAILGLGGIAWAVPQTEEIALRQIVLPSEQEANEVRSSLVAGASFEDLASERSRDATAQHGGYLGRMRLADLRSEVRSALDALRPGQVSHPVRIGNTFV